MRFRRNALKWSDELSVDLKLMSFENRFDCILKCPQRFCTCAFNCGMVGRWTWISKHGARVLCATHLLADRWTAHALKLILPHGDGWDRFNFSSNFKNLGTNLTAGRTRFCSLRNVPFKIIYTGAKKNDIIWSGHDATVLDRYNLILWIMGLFRTIARYLCNI